MRQRNKVRFDRYVQQSAKEKRKTLYKPAADHVARHTWSAAVVAILAVLLAVGAGFSLPQRTLAAPASTADETWVTDGRVSAIVRAGDRIYLGGSFTLVGPNTGFGVVLSSTNGQMDSSFPRVNDKVRAVVADGSGGWYIGGDFQRVGSAFRPGLAHVLASGEVDPNWKPRVEGSVNALALSPDGSRLYVGGAFTGIDGETRNRLAALDAATGAVDANWNPDANGAVNALALSPDGSRLYAGGAFTSVSGASHPRLAALDAATGAVDPNWDPNANNAVNALAVSPDGARIYAGGNFTAVRGVSRNYLSALDSVRGLVDTGWNPDANGVVNALVLSPDGERLHAGGAFTTLGGVVRNRLAVVDATTGVVGTWDPNANKAVASLAISPAGDLVYVGGDFTGVGGGKRNRLVAVDAATGKATSWNPVANGTVNALAPSADGGRVYAGGALTSVGGVSRPRLAALNAATGEVDPQWSPRANRPVYTLALSPDATRIYVGGDFTTVGGASRSRLAALDATTGVVDGTWNPVADATVRALAVSERGVYAGGNFMAVNGSSRVRLALLDSTTGAVDPVWDASANDLVRALNLSPDESRLYVGGEFTEVSGQTRKKLVALDAATGTLDNVWKPVTKRPVFDLESTDARVFTAEGGAAGGAVTAYGADAGALAWSLKGDGDAQAIALLGDKVYAGGHFNLLGDQVRNQIAAIDASTGIIDSQWAPTIDGDPRGGRGVWALVGFDTQLYVGGDFSRVSGKPQQGFARFSE